MNKKDREDVKAIVEEALKKADVDSRKEEQLSKKVDLKDILPDL